MNTRRMLLALDRRVLRSAATVITISERFAEHYHRTRSVDSSRIRVVPNWLPSEGTEEAQGAAERCRDRNTIPCDAFLLTYGGNVGVSAAVETVIEAFRYIPNDSNVHLLIAGEGASLDNCRRLAEEVAPQRIHFEHPWLDTMGVLHAADVVVLPTRASQSMTSVPSKVISYLLSGRPLLVLALTDSDTAAIVQRSGAGVIVEPDHPEAVAEAILAMRRLSHEERRAMGTAGRAWAIANVSAEVCLPKLLSIIEARGGGSA